ncbi:molybdopterin converting factor subunit 1 [Gracilibacillus ureilyticus]|nr:molybdopterin converting factor subunit 1 [Gracilibacillus ureilyticus]
MINILFFAQIQQETGKERIELDTEEITVKELREYLINQLKINQVSESMVAVNEAYALDTDIVRAGDTVAIIPPVSGG